MSSVSHYDTLRLKISTLNSELDTIEYHQAREEMTNIQKYFEQHLLSAQVHEKKTANRELHDLSKKIEKKKPKKKFNLIRKNKPVPKPAEVEPELKTAVIPEIHQKATIENKTSEQIVYEAKEGEDLVFRNFEDSKITIIGNCMSIIVENFKNSHLIMENCIFGAAMVRNGISFVTIFVHFLKSFLPSFFKENNNATFHIIRRPVLQNGIRYV